MIRKLTLKCSFCSNIFDASQDLYYKDDFITSDFSQIKLMCPNCHKQWENHYIIISALFYEENHSIYADIVLENNIELKKIYCTPLNDTIVADIDLPDNAKNKLFALYTTWLQNKRKDNIKECIFHEEHMKTTFSCKTFGGEEFENIAFRFNRRGELETEIPIPKKIISQIIEAWNLCEITGNNHFIQK